MTMRNPGLIAVSSLIILMIMPAYADVETLTLDRQVFSINDKFTISGTVGDEDGTLITATLNGPGSKLNRNAVSNGGTFTFTPISAGDFFKGVGTYTINVFTEYQQPANGTVIKIEYADGSATLLPDYELVLIPIGDQEVEEGEKLSFTARITDSSVTHEEFSLNNNPRDTTINKDTGVFSWTPTSTQSGVYLFDIVVKAGPLEDSETIRVTVSDKPVPKEPEQIVQKTKSPAKPQSEPPAAPEELGIASFVDESKDPQSYVDRYDHEPGYKEWFDKNYAEYDSIYQAVGLDEPAQVPAPFVDESEDPQFYVDRYDNEPAYKAWFDENFSEYDSIYHAVGLDEQETEPVTDGPAADSTVADEPAPDEPPQPLAPFVDESEDPQFYVDRYDNEPSYKAWFDENYPEYDSIHQAVGLDESVTDEEFGECGTGTDLIDGMCVVVDGSGGGGCLIATAAYGSEMAPQVQLLREIRDGQLMNTQSGMSFMTGFNQFYYSFSPQIADMQRENPVFKEAVKIGITPLLSTLSVMSYAETELQVFGYGIGVILMNLGMYVGIPAIILYKTQRYVKFYSK